VLGGKPPRPEPADDDVYRLIAQQRIDEGIGVRSVQTGRGVHAGRADRARKAPSARRSNRREHGPSHGVIVECQEQGTERKAEKP
jgi:hypothetical protein